MTRNIYWRVGKDSGVFTDLKTLQGALARLERRLPDAREYEVQFDAPVGTEPPRERLALRTSDAGTRYFE